MLLMSSWQYLFVVVVSALLYSLTDYNAQKLQDALLSKTGREYSKRATCMRILLYKSYDYCLCMLLLLARAPRAFGALRVHRQWILQRLHTLLERQRTYRALITAMWFLAAMVRLRCAALT